VNGDLNRHREKKERKKTFPGTSQFKKESSRGKKGKPLNNSRPNPEKGKVYWGAHDGGRG